MGRALALLACSAYAFALNPELDVNQYAHKSWTTREGFFKGAIQAIAQTPDGYLWLGAEFGLLRFDGVKADAWQPPPDQPLPSNAIITARICPGSLRCRPNVWSPTTTGRWFATPALRMCFF
jgi:ligand-binding sensor domain-containing protein